MPMVIAFASQKGGVGKSTLARALAAFAAKRGVNVRVADLDVQQSTIEHWRKRRAANGLKPPIDVVSYRNMEEALASSRGTELLIVDSSGRASRASLEIAKKAHLVVQPTGPGLDDLHPGVLLFHELVNAGVPESRLVFALCRVWTKEEESAARDYLQKAGYAILPGSLAEKPAYRSAQNSGRAITETDDAALNARVSEMLEALLERLNTMAQASDAATDQRARKV